MVASKISPFKNSTLSIGSIDFTSTARTFPVVIILLETCDQPPGKEPKSNKFIFFLIKLNFWLSSISLNEALDR